MPTGIRWLDAIVEEANLPKTVDREGAALVLSRLLGVYVTKNTVRRWPLPYKVVGRYARYEVDDLIKYARKRLEETPTRLPSPREPAKPDQAAASAA
jgi:hypothetical protein